MVIVSILKGITLDWIFYVWRIGLYSLIYGNHIIFHLHLIVWQNILMKELVDDSCIFFVLIFAFFFFDVNVFKFLNEAPEKYF